MSSWKQNALELYIWRFQKKLTGKILPKLQKWLSVLSVKCYASCGPWEGTKWTPITMARNVLYDNCDLVKLCLNFRYPCVWGVESSHDQAGCKAFIVSMNTLRQPEKCALSLSGDRLHTEIVEIRPCLGWPCFVIHLTCFPCMVTLHLNNHAFPISCLRDQCEQPLSMGNCKCVSMAFIQKTCSRHD